MKCSSIAMTFIAGESPRSFVWLARRWDRIVRFRFPHWAGNRIIILTSYVWTLSTWQSSVKREEPALAEDATLPTLPRRSLVTATIDALRTKLDAGEWRIGERLPPEGDLAGGLGGSRNTAREAVRVLSHAQSLDVRQGDGTYVRSVVDAAETFNRINRSSVRDHLEMQSILEAE